MIVTAISLPKYEHRRMVHLQVQKRSTRTEEWESIAGNLVLTTGLKT